MDTIALCLSGGGYRAAAFHVGVLRALQTLGLLPSVKFLSTASGGTILAARWLAGVTRGETFPALDAAMVTFLRETNVVQRAVDDLAKAERPSLIREAADVYDELLGGMTWGALQRGGFDEVVFNATDFTGGNAFRFVKSSNDKVWVGNQDRKVKAADIDKMRVGDVVAASSCFPGAFEPIVFPRDFAGVPQTALADELPLMDGGIYDNQGVSSLLLVLERAKPPAIDLFVIADTDQKGRVYEEAPAPQVFLGTLSLARVYVVALVLTALAVLGGVAGIVALVMGTTLEARLAGASAAVGCGLIASAFAWLKLGLWPQLLKLIPFKNADIWSAIEGLSVNEVVALAAHRATSVLALTMRAFMGRIRKLTYEKVFATRGLTGKVCPVQIYALLDHADPKVKGVAVRAHETPTSLWIDDQRLADVVACGELTTYAALRARWEGKPEHAALLAQVNAAWAVRVAGL